MSLKNCSVKKSQNDFWEKLSNIPLIPCDSIFSSTFLNSSSWKNFSNFLFSDFGTINSTSCSNTFAVVQFSLECTNVSIALNWDFEQELGRVFELTYLYLNESD